MLGRHGDIGDAEQRVSACSEHPQCTALTQQDFSVRGKRKIDINAAAATYPVGLHGAHALGPTRQMVQRIAQLIGKRRDAQVVHGDLALFDQRAGAPAAPVYDLFISEHGLIDRVPIDHAGAAISDALFQHAQEQPLVPAVVIGITSGQFARPVDGQTQRLQLPTHIGDVVASPLGRRHTIGHGGVFGRQTEGIPAHGLQHIAALHAHEARQHIADGVVAHMAHVQTSRRVREHGQAIKLFAGRVLVGDVSALGLPIGLCAALYRSVFVTFLHAGRIHEATPPLQRAAAQRAACATRCGSG